jgi:PII-like signaling protein
MDTLERLTIYVGESDQWHGKPVFMALVEEARHRGLAGATVTRGLMGYGKRQHHRIHTARILELSSDLPMLVTIIDTAEAIAQFLPLVQEMVVGGIVLQETVNVVHHAPVAPIHARTL